MWGDNTTKENLADGYTKMLQDVIITCTVHYVDGTSEESKIGISGKVMTWAEAGYPETVDMKKVIDLILTIPLNINLKREGLAMTIKEIEELTGVSKQNIRFYEKKGLLSPKRNENNGYRTYHENDVYRLKEILLYRKLGFTIDDISKIVNRKVMVEAKIEHYYYMAVLQQENLKRQMVIYEDMRNDLSENSILEVQKYLDKIETLEAGGVTFFDTISDYAKKAKDTMYKFVPVTYQLWFEPENPIMNKADFVDELIKYGKNEKREINILHVGMEPIVEIDGKKFLAMLESPHMVRLPKILWLLSPLFTQYIYTYGFKFVYLYKWE